VLYVGVTAYPNERFYQHRNGLVEVFAKKYHCTKLVYVESCDTMEQAITREKQIKRWLRRKKVTLIESLNPQWEDIYETTVNSY
jgi:putative endonuclease